MFEVLENLHSCYQFVCSDAKCTSKQLCTKDFTKMEFAFKYGIWEFLIHVVLHDLTPETQLLAAIGYETNLNFLCIGD